MICAAMGKDVRAAWRIVTERHARDQTCKGMRLIPGEAGGGAGHWDRRRVARYLVQLFEVCSRVPGRRDAR